MRKIEEVFEYYNEDLDMEFLVSKDRSNVCKILKVTYAPYEDYPKYDGELLSFAYIKKPNVQFTVPGTLTGDVFMYELSKRNRMDKILKQLKSVSKYLVDLK